jgi:hypothetical protein
MVKRQNEEDIA